MEDLRSFCRTQWPRWQVASLSCAPGPYCLGEHPAMGESGNPVHRERNGVSCEERACPLRTHCRASGCVSVGAQVTQVREQSRGAGDGQAAGLGPAQIVPGVGAEMCALDAQQSQPTHARPWAWCRGPHFCSDSTRPCSGFRIQSSDDPAHSARVREGRAGGSAEGAYGWIAISCISSEMKCSLKVLSAQNHQGWGDLEEFQSGFSII